MSNRKSRTNVRGAHLEMMSGRAKDQNSKEVINTAFAVIGGGTWDGKPRNRQERRAFARRKPN